MFVTRLLMASFATVVGASIAGLLLGLSPWTSVLLALLAITLKQLLLLGYLVYVATQETPRRKHAPTQEQVSQLFLLPK